MIQINNNPGSTYKITASPQLTSVNHIRPISNQPIQTGNIKPSPQSDVKNITASQPAGRTVTSSDGDTLQLQGSSALKTPMQSYSSPRNASTVKENIKNPALQQIPQNLQAKIQTMNLPAQQMAEVTGQLANSQPVSGEAHSGGFGGATTLGSSKGKDVSVEGGTDTSTGDSYYNIEIHDNDTGETTTKTSTWNKKTGKSETKTEIKDASGKVIKTYDLSDPDEPGNDPNFSNNDPRNIRGTDGTRSSKHYQYTNPGWRSGQVPWLDITM